MIRISDTRLDDLIAEDVPYLDLTTELLGIGEVPGEIEYYTRESCVLCGTEEAARILSRLGATVTWSQPSGTRCAAGDAFLRAEGPAAVLHQAWKVCLNLLDHTSAVATKTRRIVDAAARGGAADVLATRKSMPGAKDLLMKAIMTGGAYPHRLGLSETVLVFDNHVEFMGGFDELLRQLPAIHAHCAEKRLLVEATADQARALAETGAVDGIQFDKVPPEELAKVVAELRAEYPHLALLAAGGINEQNAEAYAATGVDGLVTTAVFSAKPLDMSVRMRRK